MPSKSKNGERVARQKMREVFSTDMRAKQKRVMAMILGQIHLLSESEWERKCARLYASDAIEGPEAIARGLQMIATVNPQELTETHARTNGHS